MKNRTLAYNRDVSRRKALRKQRIAASYYWGKIYPYYDNLHQYSKNKIHCSCGLCVAKTRNKKYKRRHIHGNYAPSINYKIRDKRILDSMDFKEKEI